MRALEAIPAGAELLTDQGFLPRCDLLRRYGYTTPDHAKYDVVELPQSLIIEETQKYRALGADELAARLEYLEDKDALEEGYLIEGHDDASDNSSTTLDAYTASQDTTIPSDLRVLLQTILSAPTEYRKLKSLSDIRLASLFLDTCKVFVQILKARSQQYATSIETDTALLQEAATVGRQRAAIEVRLAEKQILKDAQKGPETIVEYFMSSRSNGMSPSNGFAQSTDGSRKRRRMA